MSDDLARGGKFESGDSFSVPLPGETRTVTLATIDRAMRKMNAAFEYHVVVNPRYRVLVKKVARLDRESKLIFAAAMVRELDRVADRRNELLRIRRRDWPG